jgi:hypothetical protein
LEVKVLYTPGKGSGVGAETGSAAVGQTKPEAPRLMDAVVERSNLLCA